MNIQAIKKFLGIKAPTTPAPTPEALPEPEWLKEWKDFRKNTPVGSEIEYAGIRLLVTEVAPAQWHTFSFGKYWEIGHVKGDYVDKNGVIREVCLPGHSALRLFAKTEVDYPHMVQDCL